VLPLVLVGGYVLAVVACDDRAAPCTVDGDCSTGEVCSGEEVCVALRADGGPPSDADIPAITVACTNDGIFCSFPSECCTGQCTNNRCGAQPGGNQPACKNQFDTCLSSNDCCQPYSCTRGLCR
jgi:hypothetical protein